MKPKPSKPPRIKRGHKKASFQPNSLEIERRVTAAEILLCRGARRTEIAEAMAKQFGISFRTSEDYTARARAKLLERSGTTRDVMRSEAMGLYESILRDPAAKPMDKIRARERIDELFGLDAPKRQELSGPDGGPIDVAPVAAGTVVIFKLPEIAPMPGGIGNRGN